MLQSARTMPVVTLLSQIAIVLAEAAGLYVLSRLLFVWVLQSMASRAHRGGRLLQWLRLPGNLVHELSHALGYLVCGYTVRRMVPCIFDRQGRGSCQPGRPWSPLALPWLASGIAAVSPLLVGTLALRGVAQALGIHLHAASVADCTLATLLVDNIWANLSALNYHHWHTYLFLYLAFSIGSELSPSEVDVRRSLPMLLIGAVSTAALIIALTRLPAQAPVVDFLMTHVQAGLSSLQALLDFGIVTTALVAAIAIVPATIIRALRG